MGDQVLRFLQQENQRLLKENELLRDEVMALRDYLAGLRSLQRAAETITAEKDPLTLVHDTLFSALTVLDAAAGSVLLLDPEADELVFVAATGALGETLAGRRMPAGLGIAGWVAQHKEPQIVNNVRLDQRFYSVFDEVFKFETVNLICVPMITRDRIVGVIEVLNKFNQLDFNEADEDLLSTLAYIAAIAIDRLEQERPKPAAQPAG